MSSSAQSPLREGRNCEAISGRGDVAAAEPDPSPKLAAVAGMARLASVTATFASASDRRFGASSLATRYVYTPRVPPLPDRYGRSHSAYRGDRATLLRHRSIRPHKRP